MSAKEIEWQNKIENIIDSVPADCKVELHYRYFYSLIVAEIDRLKGEDMTDYQTIKALAACYELQDYLAAQLAAFADETDC